MKYIHYNSSGKITGFYDAGDDIPSTDVIEITDAQFQSILDDDSYTSFWRVSNGALVRLAGLDVSVLIETARLMINSECAKKRQEKSTNVFGQTLVYVEKLQQANTFKTAGYPEIDLASYSYLYYEATALQKTGQQVADSIIAASEQTQLFFAQIEGIRMGSLEYLKQATTEGEITGIQNSVLDALQQLT